MRGICENRRAAARSERVHGLVLAALAVLLLLTACLTGGRTEAAPRPPPIVLGDEAMDSVSAGQVRMDLELAATANGTDAMTSTTGSVAIGHTTAVRVALDPSAPPEARARLLGTTDVEVGIAAGQAQAAGANHADCSANVAIEGGDYTAVKQVQNFTAVTATCSCTALAIGFLTH